MTINLILAFILTSAVQGEETGLIEEFDASTPRTGFMRLMKSPAQLLGADGAAEINHVLLADEMIEWLVYIPSNYDALSPPGVVVFVPSIDLGGIPTSWQSVMEERNLIWIAPTNPMGAAPVQERVLTAAFAPLAIDEKYRIDAQRVYVAGLDDGARIASLVQTADPATFKGGMYICGALSWDSGVPTQIDLIRRNRHVFLAGCEDSNEREIERVHDEYKDAGVEHAELIALDLRRRRYPLPGHIDEAIDYLDGDSLRGADGR